MQTSESKAPNQAALHAIAWALLTGALIIVVLSLSVANGQRWMILGSGLFVAGASAMAGGLLGFLFGIPRMLQGSEGADGDTAKSSKGNSNGESSISYRANTNLEQISDWLTKILVGVGLTQLNLLPEKMKALATFLAPAFAPVPEAGVMAGSIVVYFTIAGFLFGYLWTRLFLGSALREADVAALGAKITEMEMQMSRDAKALNATQQQLNPSSGKTEVSEEDLRNLIQAASPPAKSAILQQAWDVRSETWQDPKTKPRMELTIPILRALADSDVRNEIHEYHGQLGYALRDARTPNWSEAEKELTKAIEIRGDWRTRGWIYYEFVRAICRVQLDADFREGRPTTPPQLENILGDVKVIATFDNVFEALKKEPGMAEWMKINKLTRSILASD